MKIGARIAHLAIACGHDEVDERGDEDEADQQPERPDVRRLEPVAEARSGDLRHVAVVEVGDELRDQQEEEEQAGEARPTTS